MSFVHGLNGMDGIYPSIFIFFHDVRAFPCTKNYKGFLNIILRFTSFIVFIMFAARD